jgi:hypothetical protein
MDGGVLPAIELKRKWCNLLGITTGDGHGWQAGVLLADIGGRKDLYASVGCYNCLHMCHAEMVGVFVRDYHCYDVVERTKVGRELAWVYHQFIALFLYHYAGVFVFRDFHNFPP